MKLTPLRKEFLRIILTYGSINISKIILDNSVPTRCNVADDGFITFYTGKSPIWWKRLCNDFKGISLLDCAFSIADSITGLGNGRNEFVFDGLTRAILDQAIKKKDLDCVVDILFDHMRNCSDGELGSKYINQKDIQQRAKEYVQASSLQKGKSKTGQSAYFKILVPGGGAIPIYGGDVEVEIR